jgi:hypothetical protein
MITFGILTGALTLVSAVLLVLAYRYGCQIRRYGDQQPATLAASVRVIRGEIES